MTQPQPSDAVVLLGRGGYSAAPRRQLERMVAAVEASKRYLLVVAAMVDQGEPSLPRALDQCMAAGARRALVLPVFVPGDANLETWLAKVARRWQEAQGGAMMPVIMGAGVGDHAALDAVVLEALHALHEGVDAWMAPPAGWEHDPAGWSRVPHHHHHLLTCRGPRCTALGADICWQRLRERIAVAGLSGTDERVLTAATGCLYPCNHGPVLVVYPDGAWYGDLTPDIVDEVVAEHLLRGQPLQHHRIVPGGASNAS